MNSDGTPDWTVIDKYVTTDGVYFVCMVEDLLYELPFFLEDMDQFEVGDVCLDPNGALWTKYYRVEQKFVYTRVK